MNDVNHLSQLRILEDGILHIVLPAPQQQKALPANPNLIEIE